jgi:hypothetical protein
MKGSLAKRLGLPENVSVARRYTRIEDKRLEQDTLHARVGGGRYVGGVEFRRQQGGGLEHTKITGYTVENGTHKIMCEFFVNELTGKIACGRINSMGWIEADQDYFDRYVLEMEESERGWDVIN